MNLNLMQRIARKLWLTRALVFTTLWLVLTSAEPTSWLIGVPAVIAATLASRWFELADVYPTPALRGPLESGLGLAAMDLAKPHSAPQTTSRLNIHLLCLPGFLAFFVVASARGGFDIAARILAREMEIAPGFLTYRTALRTPAARVFFMNLISLLPGTLSADYEGPDELIIHALDTQSDNYREIAQLELEVVALFGENIGMRTC